MSGDALIPIEGCWVRRREDPAGVLGCVLANRRTSDAVQLQVLWPDQSTEWIPLSLLRSGFQPGWAIQDVPLSATRKPLGEGYVIGTRELGNREQALVQLSDDGKSVWLPYENLRRIKDATMRYERSEVCHEDHGERLRLRLLAYALENWNHLTGALDRLEVDPLPHQIQLVHRILSSGNYNWLIADDVGLGKTIEVGLLLAALNQKGLARRVLVVSPAGLVRQWQDELQFKFDQQFRIYGHDFTVQRPDHWRLYQQVIVSLDLAKQDTHMEMFRHSGGWDVVVFDEGHKLTRYATGERTDRYRLAELLRPMADSFLLLSGTPHQGYTDRFISILELVRPDLHRQIQTLEANPDLVGDIILRNRKNEVTDVDGNFVFRGQAIHRVSIEPSEETRRFHQMLRDYLRNGYRSGERAGAPGRAIGFVMTTYRKLASSSIAAIRHALELRLAKLLGAPSAEVDPVLQSLALDELTEGGDDQDDLISRVDQPATEFFSNEREQLRHLLATAKVVAHRDEKLDVFMNKVVRPLARERKKLLIFTEYRATQTYLRQALEQRLPGGGSVVQINGSMTLDEKLAAIEAFNNGAQYLISTEAGGEGINLHESCNVMVNYDLPWNPARIVQRVGRLYRYGQKETVVVFNLHAKDSFDNLAIDLMLQKVMQIAKDMAPVGTEYNDRLYAEILGDVLDSVDLAAILQSATQMRIERTASEIEEAVASAQRAKELQDEIFRHVVGYDPSGLAGTLGFTMQHVNLFIRGMLPFLGVQLQTTMYDGAVLEIRLPDGLRGRFSEFHQRTVVRITTDRRIARRLEEVVLLDFKASFFRHLISTAKAQPFGGQYASVFAPGGEEGILSAFQLRWQNDQGSGLTEEFATLFLTGSRGVKKDPPFLIDWLVSPVHSLPPPDQSRKDRRGTSRHLREEANRLLGEASTRFKHPNGLVMLAGADFRSSR